MPMVERIPTAAKDLKVGDRVWVRTEAPVHLGMMLVTVSRIERAADHVAAMRFVIGPQAKTSLPKLRDAADRLVDSLMGLDMHGREARRLTLRTQDDRTVVRFVAVGDKLDVVKR